MPVTAVLCPHPPMLLPEVSGPGAQEEVRTLRTACRDAVVALLASRPRRLAVAGTGARTTWHEVPDRSLARAGTVGGFGAGEGGPATDLPLSLAAGSWILDQVGADRLTAWPDIAWLEVDAGTPPAECRHLGTELASAYDALLVLGDGSSRRGAEPPGGADGRAAAFDAGVAAALAGGDGEALLGIDPRLAAELGAGGRAVWQVLAGWAARRTTRGRLVYDAAPFGVGYHVATWSTPPRAT